MTLNVTEELLPHFAYSGIYDNTMGQVTYKEKQKFIVHTSGIFRSAGQGCARFAAW